MVDEKKKDFQNDRLIAQNRRARFDYTLETFYEAGIALVGSEVKSLRSGQVQLVDAFAAYDRGEIWLKQLTIPHLEQARSFPHDPVRPRRLLLHAREIAQIKRALERGGTTLIPIRLYFKEGRVKVELAIAKGKKSFDKRAVMAERTAEREANSLLKRARQRA